MDAGTTADAAVIVFPDARPAPDATPEDPPGTIRSARTPTPPLLDGSLSEWAGQSFVTFDMRDAGDLHRVHPEYVDSASARFASMHDAQWIYLAIEVTDDRVISDSEQLFDDDSITIFVDATGNLTGTYGVDDHEIIISAANFYVDYTPGTDAELTGEVVPSPGGYTIEAGISKASLNVPVLPASIGFDIAINDDDDHGSPTGDAYGLWHWDTSAVCPTCCQSANHAEAWCDTTVLGRMILE